jgi:hypothetical protein
MRRASVLLLALGLALFALGCGSGGSSTHGGTETQEVALGKTLTCVSGCGGALAARGFQADRIEHCLHRAGLETKRGRILQVSNGARRTKVPAIFVGPHSSPTLTMAILTPELVDHYRTQVGHLALQIAGGEILAQNVLIQPDRPENNPDPQVRQGTVTFGSGDHIDLIKSCAAS